MAVITTTLVNLNATTGPIASSAQSANLNVPGSQYLPNVTRLAPLDLSQCAEITDAALQNLATLSNLVPLNLNLAGTNVTTQTQLPVGDLVNIEGINRTAQRQLPAGDICNVEVNEDGRRYFTVNAIARGLPGQLPVGDLVNVEGNGPQMVQVNGAEGSQMVDEDLYS